MADTKYISYIEDDNSQYKFQLDHPQQVTMQDGSLLSESMLVKNDSLYLGKNIKEKDDVVFAVGDLDGSSGENNLLEVKTDGNFFIKGKKIGYNPIRYITSLTVTSGSENSIIIPYDNDLFFLTVTLTRESNHSASLWAIMTAAFEAKRIISGSTLFNFDKISIERINSYEIRISISEPMVGDTFNFIASDTPVLRTL